MASKTTEMLNAATQDSTESTEAVEQQGTVDSAHPKQGKNTPEPESLVRLNVNLTQESAAALRATAAAKGISYTEAVRRAIAITGLIDEQLAKLRTIQTIDEQGTIRELVFL